jgi:CelD/BcsL family acetyltransferase involved in cellulose biosynthesis
MGSTVAIERFQDANTYAERTMERLRGQHIFLLPRWIQTWRRIFEPNDELHICVMERNEELIGIAPMSIKGTTASFVGDPEICDYLDFIIAPGSEKEFYQALLDDLSKRGVTELDLRCLRPESTVFSHLAKIVRGRNAECAVEPDDVSVEMDLPADWNEYLNTLTGQQRHEIRRKFRRLDEKGDVHFVALEEAGETTKQLDTFLRMFRESRSDKAAFMHSQMESFFRLMINAMAEEGILRLFLLKLDDSPVAAALCFDYENTMYLYNSGYDPRHGSLSVGLLCKILSVKHAIEIGRKKYDFLKGDEPYKYHLGGREVRLSRCRIVMNPK